MVIFVVVFVIIFLLVLNFIFIIVVVMVVHLRFKQVQLKYGTLLKYVPTPRSLDL